MVENAVLWVRCANEKYRRTGKRKPEIIDRKQERIIASQFVKKMNVRTPSLEQQIGKLSGGNQQKVVLARWLAAKPKVLILDEPTRGIDVGAKAEIYKLIDELAGEGLSIMFISSELPEIIGLSDRVYVMCNGRITGELNHDELTEEKLLELSMADELAETAKIMNNTENATL